MLGRSVLSAGCAGLFVVLALLLLFRPWALRLRRVRAARRLTLRGLTLRRLSLRASRAARLTRRAHEVARLTLLACLSRLTRLPLLAGLSALPGTAASAA